MGGNARPLQGPLGAASVGAHHIVVGDDVGGIAQPQPGDVLAQPVNQAPAGNDRITAAGVAHGGSEVEGNHNKTPFVPVGTRQQLRHSQTILLQLTGKDENDNINPAANRAPPCPVPS